MRCFAIYCHRNIGLLLELLTFEYCQTAKGKIMLFEKRQSLALLYRITKTYCYCGYHPANRFDLCVFCKTNFATLN